jgi:hypothetical protein
MVGIIVHKWEIDSHIHGEKQTQNNTKKTEHKIESKTHKRGKQA